MMKCPSESEIKAFLDRPDSQPSDREWSDHFDRCARCQKVIAKETTEFLGTGTLNDISATEISPLLRYYVEGTSLKPETLAKLLLIPKGFARSKKGPPIEEEHPEQIDGFEVVEPIGKGGMGQVYKVFEAASNKEFAIKLLSTDLATQPEALRRAQREIAALRSLDHRNIVKFHSHGCWNDRPYLVTELLQGNDLALLAQTLGRFSVPHACSIGIQTARGLAYAHENGVVHRDIKPGNIFVTTDGIVKILDFGVAQFPRSQKQPADLTPTGFLMGTGEFMAPEQIDSLRRTDLRSDIYSLGCVLTHLLTGNPVFGRKSHYETLVAHRTIAAPSLRKSNPDIPEALDEFVLHMLAKDPTKRPRSMDEVIKTLSLFADDSTDDSADLLEGETADSKGQTTDVEIKIVDPQPSRTHAPVHWGRLLVAGLLIAAVATVWLIATR